MSGNLDSCVPCDCNFPIAPVGEQGPQGAPGPAGPRGPQGPAGGGGGQAGLENVAAMVAMLPSELTDFDVVQTNGYYVAGDGGGGRYRYLSTATNTPDGGSVFMPTSGVGRFFLLDEGFFNSKQFGAKADGTVQWLLYQSGPLPPVPTDDTVAVQAAFDYASLSGSQLNMIEGIYNITAPLTISKGWGITVRGKPFNYLTRNFAIHINSFLQTILARNFNGVLLTVRGALSSAPSVAFPLRPTDADILDYDGNSGYRHSGSVIENLVLASKIQSTATLWVVKRLARCNFNNVVTYTCGGIGTEISSADDSQFLRCFWYVCGTGTFFTGFPAVVVHRQVAETATEMTLVATNTLHFFNCDWEGNIFGNFACSRAVTETQSIIGLFFIGGLSKTVSVWADGVTAFDLFHVDTVRLDLDSCNMTSQGFDGTGTTGHVHTATEILKLDNCVNVFGTIFMEQTGSPPQLLILSRYVTIVSCVGIDLRLNIEANILPVEPYLVNVASSTQVRVQGTIRLPTDESGYKLCNLLPDQTNNPSSVLLSEIISADMNSTTADQLFTVRAARYRIKNIFVDNPLVNMNAPPNGGVYTDVGKGGTIIVAAAQSYVALATAADNVDATLTTAGGKSMTDASLYLSLTNGQPMLASKPVAGITRAGATATVHCLLHGYSTGNIIEMSGALQAEYNIRARITRIDANFFTYQVVVVGANPITPATTGTAFAAAQVPTADFRIFGDVLQ